MVRIPSVKTIKRTGCSDTIAKEIRAIMEKYYRKFPISTPRPDRTLPTIQGLLGNFSVEHIRAGNNKRSPAIDYVNTGDLYDITVFWCNGRFQVGAVADIIERGNYD